MGKRPRFNLKGTVTVTRQRHHQQAKHASPTLRHWVRLERRREAGPTLSGRLPRTRRPASMRRHCSGGSSATPSSTQSHGCCSQRLLSWRMARTHKWCASKASAPLCWCVGETWLIGASRWKSPWGISEEETRVKNLVRTLLEVKVSRNNFPPSFRPH